MVFSPSDAIEIYKTSVLQLEIMGFEELKKYDSELRGYSEQIFGHIWLLL